MRILHTADWHLNDHLGRIDRTADIQKAVTQIAVYLDEYAVDVLLLAGDVFSERSRPDQMRAALGFLRDTFLPFLQRGGTLLAISGNHDSEIFFETLRQALDLAAPGTAGQHGVHPAGRLYLAPRPCTVTLAGHAGEAVQFVLMPYPTPRAYLQGEAVRYATIEERNRLIQSAFTNVLGELQRTLQPNLPAVLMSHIHVRGVQAHTLYKVSELEDVVFEPGDIPTHFAYVAYGHIHRAQEALAGAPHVRYAGSPERLDGAEAGDEKSVVLLEIGPEGLSGTPVLLPLEATPVRRLHLKGAAEVSQLATRYPDEATTLLHYTLHYDPREEQRDALVAEINRVFPRWYGREIKITGTPAAPVSGNAHELHDVPGTVRAYLQQQCTTAEWQRLQPVAEALLAEREQA